MTSPPCSGTNMSSSKVEWRVDAVSLGRIAPIAAQLRLEPLDFGCSMFRHEARGCRPRANIADQVLQRALATKRERRRRYFVERKWNRSVPVEYELSLGSPVGLDSSSIEAMKNLLELRCIQHRIGVAPDGNCTTRIEDALRFGEECFGLEPVERLRNGH